MREKVKILFWLAACLLLVAAVLFVTDFPVRGQALAGQGSLEFDFTSADAGWILLEGRLHRTWDAGQTWADVTPASADGSEIRSAYFLDNNGWVLLTQMDDQGISIYALGESRDDGANWNVRTLDLFQADETWIQPQSVHLFFLDAQNGWLVVRHASSSNFNIGTLFRTRDGGFHWERLSIPISEPVVFVSIDLGYTAGGVTGNEAYRSPDGGLTWESIPADASELPLDLLPGALIQPVDASLTQLDMLSAKVAWAQVSNGECQFDAEKTRGTCSSTSSLRRTLDGGLTWEMVPLPGFPDGLLETRTEIDNESQPFGLDVFPAGTQPIIGQGFDICEIPELAKLAVWWNSSPYTAVNLYIGGSARACANSNLTASYLSQLQRQGWKFIPTWVGPQAPCTNYLSKMSYYYGSGTNLPYLEGVAEAVAALQVAQGLGLTGPDKSGTVIYYDIETYKTDLPYCVDSVRHFMIGWTEEMESYGSVSGVYGNASSGLNAFAYDPTNPATAIYPKAAWLAHWIFPGYDSTATVWNVFQISNTLWPNHRRLRQYAGDHTEAWGKLPLGSIDSNALDGVIAVRVDSPLNDDFSAATLIPSAPYADGRDITTATSAADDPVLPCASTLGAQSTWYRFTPTVSGRALISTAGSDFDTVLAVWTGTRGSLVSQACDDNSIGQQSEVQLDLLAGVTYTLEVAAKNPVTSGKSFLALHQPASDDINAAVTVTGVPFSHTMTTTSAGDSNDDPILPVCNLAPGRASVWYAFTPTASGWVSMDTFLSSYDTVLAVWSGNRGVLSLVACNNNYPLYTSYLEANLVAGTSYYIEIAQYNGAINPAAASLADDGIQVLAGGTLNFHVTPFYDVPVNHSFVTMIERLKIAGITAGCAANPRRYCPESRVTRAEMAVFLLRAKHGSTFSPPPASGIFSDVPSTHWALAWIEKLYDEGITTGCLLSPLSYCPNDSVTRAQMAVFLLRAKYSKNYTPPTPTGIFSDVPTSHWAAGWIEKLYADGITVGCSLDKFCPEGTVTRGEMAAFLVRTFNLP